MMVRQFVSIPPEYEFRAFVMNGNLTATTTVPQLYYSSLLFKNRRRIGAIISNFWYRKIKEKVSFQDYTIDFALSSDLETIWVLELNYPPPITDTILFEYLLGFWVLNATFASR
eukprot:TRINITY_DN4183_c0_g2_i2.p1 TRINITY_DN4183_c0_g2~~TRINITY_DN4183_c0_g2_i2.p1  ORF type:complete len:114 (-),score=22.62 TRINITY_DN4183_c0_g2_i2:13-354(-)